MAIWCWRTRAVAMSHVCPFGRVEWMRSRDGGRTWSWPEVLLDSPIDDRDSGVIETTVRIVAGDDLHFARI